MAALIGWFAWIVAWIGAGNAAEIRYKPEMLCPGVEIRGKLEPPLNDAEKRLVCGDLESKDPRWLAWRTIPPAQARFHLRAFLQERGYLHPKFIELENGNSVELGPLTKVSSLSASNAPPELHTERRRKILGQTLTPAILSDVEKWTTSQLMHFGYPCPTVKATGDSETGAVVAHVVAGDRQPLENIVDADVPGLDSKTLRRYDAFRPGWLFDADALTLTENRAVAAGVVQNLHFTTVCEAGRERRYSLLTNVREEAVVGPPRLFSLGFGMNTEGLLLVRAEWANTRLGLHASNVDLTVRASSKERLIQLLGRWYFLPQDARFHLRPLVSTDHRIEQYFESLGVHFQATPATSLDFPSWGGSFVFGPALDFYRTLQGSGQGNTHFTSLLAQLGFQTHDFEFYAQNPRSGLSGGVSVAASSAGIYSSTDAQRLNAHWEGLLNYRDYDPPLLVFAMRGAISGVLSSERPGPSSLIPAVLFNYLGGSADIRGFGRLELPDPYGGMASVFTDLEVRLANTLPVGLEPFAFVDFGAMGKEPFIFDPPIYSSPGIGIRWGSPIGVFRSTLAHGFPSTAAVQSHWQFYLSYGEEF